MSRNLQESFSTNLVCHDKNTCYGGVNFNTRSSNDGGGSMGLAVTFIVISVLLLMIVCYQYYYFSRRIHTIETSSKDLELEARKTL